MSLGQLKSRPHLVAQARDGGTEEMVEKFTPFAENSPQRFGHRKHKLPVRHLEAEDAGDPVAGLTDFPLMAAWAKMPRLAGEGEEARMPAIGALEPGESGGKVHRNGGTVGRQLWRRGAAGRGCGGGVSRSLLRSRTSSGGQPATAVRRGDGVGGRRRP